MSWNRTEKLNMNLKIAFGTVVYPETVPYIKDFFTSLGQQTYGGFDILCINEGIHCSILSEMQKILTQKIIVIDVAEEKEFNIAANRILLLEEAKRRNYDLLVIGDSDDTFSRDRVEQIMIHFKEEVVFYYNQLVTPNGIPVFPPLPKTTGKINQILEKNYLGMSNTAINMKQLNLSFIQSLTEGTTNIFDWYLYSRILNEVGIGKLVGRCYTQYRIYDQNIAGIMKMDKEQLKKEILVKREHYEILKRRNIVFHEALDKYNNVAVNMEQVQQKPPYYWWGMLRFLESED